jgi:glucose/arabinose dehydrogenase
MSYFNSMISALKNRRGTMWKVTTNVLLISLLLSVGSTDVLARQALSQHTDIGLRTVAEGLTAPVYLVSPPEETRRLFIVDQAGAIYVVDEEGEMLEEPFLDLQDRIVELREDFDERGLLGLAFHPDYAANGRLFVYYSAPLRPEAPADFDHTSHVSEFSVDATDPDRVDTTSERILLQVDQPQFNHNGGDIHFGPDGHLYIALGDGGGANDVGPGHTPELGNAQDATNLLGSLLRIDVDTGDPYAIPEDNPFIGTIGRDEIFAYGLRNPYRFAFHGDDLYVADVGQNLFEEVNLVDLGGNYGWNVREGTHCFDPASPNEPPETCPDTGPLFGDPLLDPIIEYGNARLLEDGVGIAVIGGRVYEGRALPQLSGRYVFGDWSTNFLEPDGTLMVAKSRPHGLWKLQELRIAGRPDARLGHYVLGFGQDDDGEVYVLTSDSTGPVGDTGIVYRLTRPRG